MKLDGEVLTIQVPSQFFYEWLEEHYVSLLRKTVRKELGADARLEYSIIMEHVHGNASSSPYTVNMPTTEVRATRNAEVAMPIVGEPAPIKNPFVIPGFANSTLIPTSTPTTPSSISLKANATGLHEALVLPWPTSPAERPSTPS